jgi:hypothetical protein
VDLEMSDGAGEQALGGGNGQRADQGRQACAGHQPLEVGHQMVT